MNQTLLDRRAQELRHAFDRSFAEAPRGEEAALEAFLAINVGGDGYALRLGEIAGLHADRKVTPLPGATSGLLGLTGFRGILVPVYDLQALLGYPAGPVPRWLVLAASPTPVGLAFSRFDEHLRLPRDAITHADGAQHGRQHIAEALSAGGQVRPIVSVASVIESIKKRAQSSAA